MPKQSVSKTEQDLLLREYNQLVEEMDPKLKHNLREGTWEESQSKAIEIVKSIQQEKPQIHFMDGHPLSGKEAWDKCLEVVLQRLQDLS